MTIQILFLKKNDLIGKIIKHITKGEYTHCAFLIDGTYVYDTDLVRRFQGRFLPWNSSEFDLTDINIKQVQCQELIEWIQAHNNEKYSNWENVRYLFKKLFKSKDNESRMNCTESIIDCMCFIGFLNPIYKSEILSPTDVYNLLKSRE